MNVSYRGQHSTLVIENPDPKEDVDQFGVPPVDDNMEMEERPAPDVFPAYQDETDEYNATTENVDTSFRADIPTVVLDCANIGWAYGMDYYSSHGLKLVYEYFANFEVNIVGFIPASYARRRPTNGERGNALMETEDLEILNTLISSRKLTVVPSGNNDDIYILTFARQYEAFVVSNDFFMDHIRSLTDPQTKLYTAAWLKENRCAYTFVGDVFMLDPTCSLAVVLQHFCRGGGGGSGPVGGSLDQHVEDMSEEEY